MSGGGKGGSQTSKVEIPQFVEDAAKRNLARADEISKLGYVPYMGPDVAAFTPTQMSGFQNTNDMASAFGMNTGQGMGMPEPTQYAGGVQGYSSFPLFQQAQDALAQNRPGQFDYINDFFIDPVTGAPAVNPAMQQPLMGGNMGATQPNAGGGDNVQAYHNSRLDDGMRNFDRQIGVPDTRLNDGMGNFDVAMGVDSSSGSGGGK